MIFEITQHMRYSILTIFLLLSAFVTGASAQSRVDWQNAHKKAHQRQLANVKLGMDKNTISEFMKKAIEVREAKAEAVATPSAESSQMVADLLKEARTHMGKRYRSGSKGPNAFDCSGFSSYVFRQFGYELSPSSKTQFGQGEKVEKGDLRPGDLVFFTGRSTKRGVGHVGIVVKADNETGNFSFIHASSSQGITISTNDAYYGRRYLGARRVINE